MKLREYVAFMLFGMVVGGITGAATQGVHPAVVMAVVVVHCTVLVLSTVRVSQP